MKKLLLTTLITATLVGCASANPQNKPQVDASHHQSFGTVLMYRTNSLQAKLADAYIGIGEDYFAQLDENQYTEFNLNTGFHEFRAKAHGSVSAKANFKINAGEKVCIQVQPNHEELEWLVLPFVNAMIPSFVMKETACPSLQHLSKV